MKVILSEIKKNLHGTRAVVGINLRFKSMIWNIRKKKAFTQDSKNKKEFKKYIYNNNTRQLWNISKCSNIQIIGMPEAEEEEQEIKNLFEKIMKENFPNLVKEIDIQVREAERLWNHLDPKRTTPRHITIKMPKVKDNENLKSSKRKAERYLQKSSCKTVSWFCKRIFEGKKGLTRSIQSEEKQGPTAWITLSVDMDLHRCGIIGMEVMQRTIYWER